MNTPYEEQSWLYPVSLNSGPLRYLLSFFTRLYLQGFLSANKAA